MIFVLYDSLQGSSPSSSLTTRLKNETPEEIAPDNYGHFWWQRRPNKSQADTCTF